MLKTRRSRHQVQRKGMILLVVLALLTLFAIVGITFVYVASGQETSARIAREAETQFKPGVDPEAALSFALGQFLYDVNDPVPDTSVTPNVVNHPIGLVSAARGHSLARNMYGFLDGTLNDKPFNGTGRLNIDSPGFFPQNGTDLPQVARLDSALMNYQWFNGGGTTNRPSDNFLRDPERPGSRANWQAARLTYTGGFNVPYTYPDHNNFFLAQIGPVNPTTAPDDWRIICPSFHRGWLLGTLDSTNPNFFKPAVNAAGQITTSPTDPAYLQARRAKYLTLRPMPVYHPNFPMPVDQGGDVKNLDGLPGGADSIWIDIGAPVMTSTDGTKYKMLVAPLILELDSRIDLNVVGNLMGLDYDASNNPTRFGHRSNQGWGKWEINPSKVLNGDSATDPREWRRIFWGNTGQDNTTVPSANERFRGRYDTDNPTTRKPLGYRISGGDRVRGWAQVDYNASRDGPMNPMNPVSEKRLPEAHPVPRAPGASSYSAFPDYSPLTTFNNGGPLHPMTMVGVENLDHPAIYSVDRPRAGGINAGDNGQNRRWPILDLAGLLRRGGTGSDLMSSELSRTLPTNMGSAKRRNLVTLMSADLDRPGATPWIWEPEATNAMAGRPDSQATRYQFVATGMAPNDFRYSLAGNIAIPFPDTGTFRNPPAPPPPLPSYTGEFASTSWRPTFDGFPTTGRPDTWPDMLKTLLRLNLNRSLRAYPDVLDGDHLHYNLDPANMNDPVRAALDNAAADRQAFAKEIFIYLRRVTGAADPGVVYDNYGGANSGEFNALRQLAQIAVNIVDYMDNDDVMTRFTWFSRPASGMTPAITEFVFGFELPRVVINETYVQYTNHATSPATTENNVNVWVELMNPMPNDKGIVDPQNTLLLNDTTAALEVLYRAPGTMMDTPYAAHRILLADPDLNRAATNGPGVLRQPGNVTGDPNFGAPAAPGRIRSTHDVWTPTMGLPPPMADLKVYREIPPAAVAQRYAVPNFPRPNLEDKNDGFYVVGPQVAYLDATLDNPNFETTMLSDRMTYTVPVAGNATANDKQRPTVLLQRLADPRMRPQPDITLADYNPYVTIDIAEHPLDAQVADGRRTDTLGQALVPLAMVDRQTLGKRQPFASFNGIRGAATPNGQWVLQDPVAFLPPPNPPLPDRPKNTFFRQNSRLNKAELDLVDPASNDPMVTKYDFSLRVPFEWLVHLDRKQNSPMELWHVSNVPPHLVTQDFVQGEYLPNLMMQPPESPSGLHVVPWQSQESRLYRFFEFVTIPPFVTGPQETLPGNRPIGMEVPYPGGRVMGKVNINNVWSRDVFSALADARGPLGIPNQADTFTQAQVDAIFLSLLNSRSVGASGNYNAGTGDCAPMIQVTDTRLAALLGIPDNQVHRPFWSLAMGFGASGDQFVGRAGERGVNDTLLRGGGGLFDIPDPTAPTPALNPYQKKELLRKIFNHLTTRSNVYAIWLTVGFFKVEDATAVPPVLGEEIGKAENRHTRFRMFSIIDRTNMTAFAGTSTYQFPQTAPPDPTAFVPGARGEVQLNWSRTVTTNPKQFFMKDDRTGTEWEVKEGTILVYDPNSDKEETVVVQRDATTTDLFARFQRMHNQNCGVVCRGNPGPWSRYDPRKDNGVVLYFQLID